MTFIPKNSSIIPSVPVGVLLRKREVKGDIGIEIEVEGNKFPKHEYDGYYSVDPEQIPDQWNYHRDGSLRGNDNAEYVLAKPIKFSEVPTAIEDLWKMFSNYGSVLDVSNRTSVHVHLNVQRFHLNRLCSFMALYFTVEEILTAWCGDHRVGNLFCLRAKDAPAIITELKTFFQRNGKYNFGGGMHYAGFNAGAIQKFGSVEIRTLRGCTESSEILTWVGVLQRLYELSEGYTDPRRVCEGFSGQGPLTFLENILGPYYHTIVTGTPMSNQEIMASMYEGIRFAQDLCYCVDWSKFEFIDTDKDPFKRSSKQASQSLSEWMSILPQPGTNGNWINGSAVYVGNTSTTEAFDPVYDEEFD